jgi:predicted extracellular nuclease
VDRKAGVVVLGDLNDYQFSPALSVLRTGTADGIGPALLTDLISTLPVDQRYTYVFNGVSQVLDHILVGNAVAGVEYQVVHINAEYSDQASDHDPQVVRLTV